MLPRNRVHYHTRKSRAFGSHLETYLSDNHVSIFLPSKCMPLDSLPSGINTYEYIVYAFLFSALHFSCSTSTTLSDLTSNFLWE